MGGKAIQQLGFPEKRLGGSDFALLRNRAIDRLHDAFPESRCTPIPSYFEKVDHGDLDILVESDRLPGDFHELARRVLGSSLVLPTGPELVKVSPTLTYEVDGFQVDLIRAPAEEFDFTLKYYAFNDLGNLIGRIAESLGFKFGHKGLFLRLTQGKTKMIKEVLVTRDFDKALVFLGYDPDVFARGFSRLSDIMNYAASSRYYQSALYPLEHRNNKARMRDSKRKTYQIFLTQAQRYPDGELESRHEALHRALKMFPGFNARYQEALKSYAQAQAVKAVLNGHLVSQWTGLKGVELGRLMASLRSDKALMMTAQSLDVGFIRDEVLRLTRQV